LKSNIIFDKNQILLTFQMTIIIVVNEIHEVYNYKKII